MDDTFLNNLTTSPWSAPDSSMKTRWAASLAAFFLHGARQIVSILRWPRHRDPRPDVLVSGGSNQSGAGVSRHDSDAISLPIDVRSDRQFAEWSTTLFGIHESSPPGSGDEQAAFFVSRLVEEVAPVPASHSVPFAHRIARHPATA